LNGVFVRFSTRGVQKHHQKFFGEIPYPMSKTAAKKTEGNKPFFLALLLLRPSICFIAFFFGPFLCMRSSKGPENLKKSPQKKAGTRVDKHVAKQI
jgi:hypothetical protein